MTPPRVFVIQQPAKFDSGSRAFVPKYDLSAAEKFGELIYLIEPGGLFRDNTKAAIVRIKRGLETFTRDDFILALGDPVAIAAACLIAGARAPSVNLLKWDRHTAAYEAYSVTA